MSGVRLIWGRNVKKVEIKVNQLTFKRVAVKGYDIVAFPVMDSTR